MSTSTAEQFAGQTLDVVMFRTGNQRCAVEARLVRASRPLPQGAEPGVPSLAPRLGLEDEGGSARQLLLFKHPQADIPYTVTPPVQLQAIPLEQIHPLPPLVSASTCIHGLRALILDAEGIVLLVELEE